MDEEFEITRPHGTPRLYRFLIRQKLRRATRPLGNDIDGSTALTVCGGSGMDAEFLVRAGWMVISSDISIQAARRTRSRAQRFGVRIAAVVADIEHLPFADASIDLVLVHDGLHHLDRPEVGLAEMARVARRWVSVTEPARAAVTKAAVRVGFATEWEDAGNRVWRLTSAYVQEHLADAGYKTLSANRYAMYYRHEPGRLFQIMSHGCIFPLVRVGWRAGNAFFGRFGNKLVVVAERTESATGQPGAQQ
jgi:ubiquinone/menaquinone biosynthesis C-methylase UbiE